MLVVAAAAVAEPGFVISPFRISRRKLFQLSVRESPGTSMVARFAYAALTVAPCSDRDSQLLGSVTVPVGPSLAPSRTRSVLAISSCYSLPSGYCYNVRICKK